MYRSVMGICRNAWHGIFLQGRQMPGFNPWGDGYRHWNDGPCLWWPVFITLCADDSDVRPLDVTRFANPAHCGIQIFRIALSRRHNRLQLGLDVPSGMLPRISVLIGKIGLLWYGRLSLESKTGGQPLISLAVSKSPGEFHQPHAMPLKAMRDKRVKARPPARNRISAAFNFNAPDLRVQNKTSRIVNASYAPMCHVVSSPPHSPFVWRRGSLRREDSACLVQDISNEAPLRARTEIPRTGTQNRHTYGKGMRCPGMQACAATFFASVRQFSGFSLEAKNALAHI